MNKDLLKNIIITLLASITIFSIVKFILTVREKNALLDSLNQAKEEVASLEARNQDLSQSLDKEKTLNQKLTQQNSGLKGTLKAGKKRLSKLFKDRQEKEKAIEELNLQSSLLKAENVALKENISQLSKENEGYKVKLSSAEELKKAIRELNTKKRKPVKLGTTIKKEPKKSEANQVIDGNRGYIIKDGQPTYPTKVKIEVIPAPTE